MPYQAFTDSAIESITIPYNVTTIGIECFKNCYNLKHVELPDTITSLGGGVFANCPSDIIITFGNESKFFLDEQYLILDVKNTTVTGYLGSTPGAIVAIPSTVSTIKTSAFLGNEHLAEVIFQKGSSLRYIQNYAFSSCSNLSKIAFPSTLESIGNFPLAIF